MLVTIIYIVLGVVALCLCSILVSLTLKLVRHFLEK